MKEKRLPYLPISTQKIITGLDGKNDEQLKELGLPPGTIFMIRQGYARQLRKDTFDTLSATLGLDISANT